MKQKLRFLKSLIYEERLASLPLRRIGKIIVALLFFSTTITAQESIPSEFVLDASMNYGSLWIDPIYNSFIDCGFNTMIQRATDDSKSLLDRFNLHAFNALDSTEWIYYYSSSYYSKWEAEEDQQNVNKVGAKHSAGESAYWYDGNDSVLCWSTKGLTGPIDTLVYGPTYHQEKWYRRWYDDYTDADRYNLKYTPRFRMALFNPYSVSDTEDVCRIYVLLKYRRFVGNVPDPDSTYGLTDTVYLKVSDFPSNGDFDYIYFSNIPSQRSYGYWSGFRDPETVKLFLPVVEEYYRDDRRGGLGVQFCIDWLRTDTLCTLYIDNIEVYDNNGWDQYIDNPVITANKIKDYANSFKTAGWDNIKYWIGGHEPSSIDSYTPIRIVDSLLESAPLNAPPLMNVVWALWTLDLNGESQLERYYNMVRPNKLFVESHPILADYDPVRPFDLEVLRRVLQESYRVTQDSRFYYHAQSYGEWENNNWYIWRFPSVPEHKATMMLALAHGADGITQASYDSYPGMKGIIREGPGYDTTDVWYSLRDNIIPRIKGKLGKTLLSLNYTGDFLGLRRYLQEEPGNNFYNTDPTVDKLYLTLSEYTGETPPPPIHFHAGFFESPSQGDNHHFLLANLITTDDRWVNVKVANDCSSHPNNRFRNIEPEENFDTTFTCDFSIDMQFPPGEGYLFQVAPVVKYGGKLIYNETISNPTTLIDEMIIQNGATLTINSTYNADRDIRIKAGGRINTNSGGTLKFYEGHKLIIEGAATLAGIASHKLIIDFISPENSNGIIIKPGGSLGISYCEVKNAVKGITSELNLYNLYIQNVNFVDCDSVAIYITGRNRLLEEITLTPPPPQIKYCSITNSEFGILASNLSQLVVQENNITGTEYGIFLTNISTPAIIGNTLTGSNEMPGIFLESCNGIVRGNSISGHTNGIYLGNSSPDIGGNTIYHNWNRGLYVGTGSLPNMRGKLVQDPIHPNTYYAVSGYNKINENGGWTIADDGSEIFINNANAILGKGCNEITDQRIPNVEDTPPLYNTQLLMNCRSSIHSIEIKAEGNFWDVHPIYRLEERFGGCNVYYEPVLNGPCDRPNGSNGKLFITSSTGEIIDTLYAEERAIETLTETEQLYATAEEKFLTADFEGAELIYNQILSVSDSMNVKLDSYRRLYEAGKLLGKDETYFTGLRDTYSTLSSSTNDTLLAKILNQLSSLSLVANQEYVPAIGEFDEIIQQNPNTEEAVYAEIDALTTALLVGDGDSTLQKGTLGKYLIKPGENYLSKLDGILRKHFGNGEIETEKELLPTEYTLYQNYPNPFNPVTTIKYDLPNASEVTLIIYDILGRKVRDLVNTKQQAGRYEVQFNASNLASGVYIYQLMAEKYMSSKKMILLK